MKIDRNKIKRTSSEITPECKQIINDILRCSDSELVELLRKLKTWSYGKCELYFWASVLDKFDEILEKSVEPKYEGSYCIKIDNANEEKLREICLEVLNFTAHLVEHSFTRHLYNSLDHLLVLLGSTNFSVVLCVLNLLYVFSKRSNFIARLSEKNREEICTRLVLLSESWGGRENGFGLAECCKLNGNDFPLGASTLHCECYTDDGTDGDKLMIIIHEENVSDDPRDAANIMDDLVKDKQIPINDRLRVYNRLRLARYFLQRSPRLQLVACRLGAISILIYANMFSSYQNKLLYSGFIEELVELLQLETEEDSFSSMTEIKAAALKTLTAFINLDVPSKLTNIIEATGASSYHGFLPVLVRNCIQNMTEFNLKNFPQTFATSLFSFLYHLASYENGCDALVSCGMMESLIKVLNWFSDNQENIMYVTRAVRVVDLITNMDMAAFTSQNGLQAFNDRLQNEINICRKEQPFELTARVSNKNDDNKMEVDLGEETEYDELKKCITSTKLTTKDGRQCYPQRSALLKSMLNFIKKAIPDNSFADSIRHLMEGALPSALKHIISNADYYGPSLFLLATDVVTVYVFQEPSLLSSLQESGLTDIVLQALLIKDVPATREVLASLPNVFSALCLNKKGLNDFIQCQPFKRLFKVLLSPHYLPAMKRRRTSDSTGSRDTASNLGTAMDELMRHQPVLRAEATKSIIRLINQLRRLGNDPTYIGQKVGTTVHVSGLFTNTASTTNDDANHGIVIDGDRENLGGQNAANNQQDNADDNASSSEDGRDDDEEEENVDIPTNQASDTICENSEIKCNLTGSKRIPIPLLDYIVNVMKFIDAILSNNTTDDHCKEFLNQKGLLPLMDVFDMRNLPLDFPLSSACQATSTVCKSIMILSRNQTVLETCCNKLMDVLSRLNNMHSLVEQPKTSLLVEEIASSDDPMEALTNPDKSPMLHTLTSVHAYIITMMNTCKQPISEARNRNLQTLGKSEFSGLLQTLCDLYLALVWESTVLLGLCSESYCTFPSNAPGKQHLVMFTEYVLKEMKVTGTEVTQVLSDGNGVSRAMECLSTADHSPPQSMDIDNNDQKSEKMYKQAQNQAKVKFLKPLLSVTSRLGRALADLFGVLSKMAVGTTSRVRPRQHPPSPVAPCDSAKAIATTLTKLLTAGLNWQVPLGLENLPRLRLTFLICSVGFTMPMLFDEKKQAYHLMMYKFYQAGGPKALIDAFKWVLEYGENESKQEQVVPDGVGEFLDSWLLLAERLVNPKIFLVSIHTLVPKTLFNDKSFMAGFQKDIFCLITNNLWNKYPIKGYGEKLTQATLSILCHILSSENQLQNKESKTDTNKESEAPVINVARWFPLPRANSPNRSPNRTNSPNRTHMNLLIDMGFRPSLVERSLRHANSLESATDWILAHMDSPEDESPDVDMTDEEETLRRAVQLSMEGSNETPAPALLVNTDITQKPDFNMFEIKDSLPVDCDTISSDELDSFIGTLIPGCINAIDNYPECTFKVCEIFVTVSKRNGNDWTRHLIETICDEINSFIIGQSSETLVGLKDDDTNLLNKLATRLHLLCLLTNDLGSRVTIVIERTKLIINISKALETCKVDLSRTEINPSVDKWITPSLVLVDLYEKISISSLRRSQLQDLLKTNKYEWKWLDDRTNKWCNFNESTVKQIEIALNDEKESLKFTASRRQYKIDFISMIQTNEVTGKRRPMQLMEKKENTESQISNEKPTSDINESKSNVKKIEALPLINKTEEAIKQTTCHVVTSFLNSSTMSFILEAMLSILQKNNNIGESLLNSIVRLLVRITREPQHAYELFQRNGINLLLNLKSQKSAFQGYITMVTLIIRHVLEFEDVLMKHTMEKVVKSAVASSHSMEFSSVPKKEMYCVLRCLAPACARNENGFIKAVTDILTIQLPNKIEDETKLLNGNQPQCLEIALSYPKNDVNKLESKIPNEIFIIIRDRLINSKENDTSDTSHIYLFDKGSLLCLVAEIVRAYTPCVHLVTDNNYGKGCSVLTYALNELLTVETENSVDKCNFKSCNPLLRTLVACIASCSHVPDAQNCLVTELKIALQKSVSMLECKAKHENIQAICSLITTAVYACPPPGNSTTEKFFEKPTIGMSNIVKILVKKNIIVDLSKIIHSLDLAGRYLVSTVNQVLKPLEILTRVVNQPLATSMQNKKSKNKRSVLEQQLDGHDHTATSTFDSSRLDVEPTAEEEGPDTTLGVDSGETALLMNVTERNNSNDGLNDLIEDLLHDVVGSDSNDIDAVLDRHIDNEEVAEDDDNEEMEDDVQDGLRDSVNETNRNADDAEDTFITAQENNTDEDDVDEDDSDDGENSDDDDDDDDDDENEDEGSDMEAGAEEDDDEALDDVRVEEFSLRDLDNIVGMRNFPIIISPDDNANDIIPNSATAVQSTHPLLSHQTTLPSDTQRSTNRGTGINSTLSQGIRQQNVRRRYRVLTHSPGTNAIHVHYSPDHPPAILQRLLGADIMQLADSIGTTVRSGLLAALTPHSIRFQRSSPDDATNNDDNDQPGIGSLAGIPSTLSRWRESSQILDSPCLYILLQVCCQSIVRKLENDRDIKIKEKREKRSQDKKDKDLTAKADEGSIVDAVEDKKSSESVIETENNLQLPRLPEISNEILSALNDTVSNSIDIVETTDIPETIEANREMTSVHQLINNEDDVGLDHIQDLSQPIVRDDIEEDVDVERIDTENNARRVEQITTTPIVNPLNLTTASSEDDEEIPPSITPEASALPNVPSLPEGIDPSFLEALPADIRQEVINNQLQIERIQRRTEETVTTGGDTNVNAEFLAALPPNIQEEILAHQRIQQTANAPPEDIDANTVLNTLTPAVRQQVLADMDDTYLNQLPDNIRDEAATYRRSFEQQQRRLFSDRLFDSSHNHSLTTFLRQPNVASRRLVGRSNQLYLQSNNTRRNYLRGSNRSNFYGLDDILPLENQDRNRGKHLLDPEPLSCLLILLFLNETSLNLSKLQKILRNLSYHELTRKWIFSALLHILQKASISSQSIKSKANWLSLTLDAALGCRANVFEIYRPIGKKPSLISIHPQAASSVCRRVIETLTTLSKHFPLQFLSDSNHQSSNALSSQNRTLDIWECLLKLDSGAAKGKGKHIQRSNNSEINVLGDFENSTLSDSAFMKLMTMLSTPVFKRSQQLTDKLLNLLSSISVALPSLCKKEINDKPDKCDTASISHSSDTAMDVSASTSRQAESKDDIDNSSIREQLAIIIDVITKKECSEDGLSDASQILVRLSKISRKISREIEELLLVGISKLGDLVCDQIVKLRDELSKHFVLKTDSDDVDDNIENNLQRSSNAAQSSIGKGIMENRFESGETIVLNANSKTKKRTELHLSTMANLTCKGSSQQYLLRMLKILLEIRQAIIDEKKKKYLASQDKNEENKPDTDKKKDESTKVDSEISSENVASTIPNTSMDIGMLEPEQLSLAVKLDNLWDNLSECLTSLSNASDPHAVLVLQASVEAFFLVHASSKSNQQNEEISCSIKSRRRSDMSVGDIADNVSTLTHFSLPENADLDTKKFLKFADKHRTVLNQILRQSSVALSDGPFSVLVHHTRILDFDVKRKYFRQELERVDEGVRREDLAVHVKRNSVFDDSFKELNNKRAEEWKNRFYIVFEGEEGQDAGGLLREWYQIISKSIFNPMYALFSISQADRVTYNINPLSYGNPNHLDYFKFVGRLIGKAIYDNKLLDCYFTRSLYKHLLGKPVKYTDMESEDYAFYQGLEFLINHHVSELGYDLTFSTEVNEYGVNTIRDLIENGRNIPVSEENKRQYVNKVCQMKMTGAIRAQLDSFLKGFYEIIPEKLISIFNEQELELLVSGLPNIDIDDLKCNSEYHKYETNSLQIQWLWRALRSFDQTDRAAFLQFVTGTSKVPLQGFAHLEGMNGTQKFQVHRDDRSTDRLPCAHTCFNQLDLPAYETYDKLKKMLLLAIHECSEGFGLA